jgi:hypothetical protein
MHIYDAARFPPPRPDARMQPDATVADYRLFQQRIGTSRTVIVNAAAYATDNEVKFLSCWLFLLLSETFSCFKNRVGNCPALVILSESLAVIHNCFNLSDGVKGFSCMHLDIDMAARFKARTKFRHCSTNTFCYAANTPMFFGEQSDDAICLA